MHTSMQAIEMGGTVDEQHRLLLDERLPITGPSRVRVIILISSDQEIDEQGWLQAASVNPVFDFLEAPEEDIYTIQDGKPFHDKG